MQQLLFDRFRTTTELDSDDVYTRYSATDEREGAAPVVVSVLARPWRSNADMVGATAALFEQVQSLRRPGIVPVRAVLRSPDLGLVVVCDPPGDPLTDAGGVRLGFQVLIEGAAEALHAAHQKKVFHGRLRTTDLSLAGDTLRLSGFGYLPAISFGWRPAQGEVAPELLGGGAPTASCDVYSLGRVLSQLFPTVASAPALVSAVSQAQQERPQRIRELRVALESIGDPQPSRPGTVRAVAPPPGSIRPVRAQDPPQQAPPLVPPQSPPPATPRVASVPQQGGTQVPSGQPAGLEQLVAGRVFDDYCDRATEQAVVQHAIQALGFAAADAKYAVAMHLESKSIASERRLIDDLDAHLHQYTDRDKVLDKKERADAVELVCRPRPGYRKGLLRQVAELRILEFCCEHAVRLKEGFFSKDPCAELRKMRAR